MAPSQPSFSSFNGEILIKKVKRGSKSHDGGFRQQKFFSQLEPFVLDFVIDNRTFPSFLLYGIDCYIFQVQFTF